MNEQAKLVQQAYQSVKAGDVQSLLNSLAEEVQWQLPETENVPFAGTWHGREQVGPVALKIHQPPSSYF